MSPAPGGCSRHTHDACTQACLPSRGAQRRVDGAAAGMRRGCSMRKPHTACTAVAGQYRTCSGGLLHTQAPLADTAGCGGQARARRGAPRLAGVAAVLRRMVQRPAQRGGDLGHHLRRARLRSARPCLAAATRCQRGARRVANGLTAHMSTQVCRTEAGFSLGPSHERCACGLCLMRAAVASKHSGVANTLHRFRQR